MRKSYADQQKDLEEVKKIIHTLEQKPKRFVKLINNGLDIFKEYDVFITSNDRTLFNLFEIFLFRCCVGDNYRIESLSVIKFMLPYYINDIYACKYIDDSILLFLSEHVTDIVFDIDDFLFIFYQFVDFFRRNKLSIDTNDIIEYHLDSIIGLNELKDDPEFTSDYEQFDKDIKKHSDMIIILKNYSNKCTSLFELMLPTIQ